MEHSWRGEVAPSAPALFCLLATSVGLDAIGFLAYFVEGIWLARAMYESQIEERSVFEREPPRKEGRSARRPSGHRAERYFVALLRMGSCSKTKLSRNSQRRERINI